MPIHGLYAITPHWYPDGQRLLEGVRAALEGGAAVIQFRDGYGKPVNKPFKVALFDISTGGISFGLKLNRRQEAAKLLGQHLVMQSGYVLDGKKQKFTQKGKIIAAHLQPFGESSVHIQFENPLSDDIMKDIVKVSGHPPEDS